MKQLSQEEFNEITLPVLSYFIMNLDILESDAELLNLQLDTIKALIKDCPVRVTTDEGKTYKSITVKDLNRVDINKLAGVIMIQITIRAIDFILGSV